MSVYNLMLILAVLSESMISSQEIDYKYIGCYADAGDRALKYGPQDHTYTIEQCREVCVDRTFFAIQYGSWCSCGDSRSMATQYGTSTACATNKTGGVFANSLYQNLNVIIDYEFLGCYADTSNRALSIDLGGGYTIASCRAACIDYQYFAIQYGSNCFCDNILSNATKYGEATTCSPYGTGGFLANSLYENLALNNTTTAPTANPTNPSFYPTAAPSFYPTADPSLYPTAAPSIAIIEGDLCPDESTGFLNTTYKASVLPTMCAEQIEFIDFISTFVNIVNINYDQSNIYVYSVTDKPEKYERVTVCGNISFHIITCFDETVNQQTLLNFTKSIDFEKEMNANNLTVIVYVENTTIHRIEGKKGNDGVVSLNTLELALLITGLIIFVFIIIALINVYNKKKQKINRLKQRDQMIITNAMVILLGIRDYDEEPKTWDPELEDVYLNDLDGIEHDITNLYELFGSNNLNYTIFPSYDNIQYPKLHWTQKEIIDLLKKHAKQLDETDEFDGLVVAVSSHGISNKICTSDYQMMEKVAIHRLFTTNYHRSRKIPRVFLFDCCDGANEHGKFGKKDSKIKPKSSISVETTESKEGDENDTIEQGKCFAAQDIEEPDSVIWERGTQNPDYKLVQIDAANPGFQSKLRSDIGSYMLYEFAKKTLDDLNNDQDEKKYIHEILDDIEKGLQEQKKQHIVTTYNDETRYIRFVKRVKEEDQYTDIEITMRNQ